MFIISTVNISHQFSHSSSQIRQDFHIGTSELQSFPPMYCKLPTTLSNNMNNIWDVNSINLLLSWKILRADSVFCFLILSRPRLCINTLVSVRWDFLSFVCTQSCRNCPYFAYIFVLDGCWPKLRTSCVTDADSMCWNICLLRSNVEERICNLHENDLKKVKRHDTLHFLPYTEFVL